MGDKGEVILQIMSGHLKTREHLFIHCDYATNLWEKLIRQMKRSRYDACNWDDYAEWIIKNSKGTSQNAQVFRVVYIEFSHAIWIKRNQQTFKDKCRHQMKLAKELTYVCCEGSTGNQNQTTGVTFLSSFQPLQSLSIIILGQKFCDEIAMACNLTTW